MASSNPLSRINLSMRARGALAIATMVGLGWLVFGVHAGYFSNNVTVHIVANRAGLLLQPGSDVALRNVRVGEVTSVHSSPDGAVIDLSIDPRYAREIGPSAIVQILSPTVLGPKYVNFVPMSTAAPTNGLTNGETLPASSVEVEANAVFQNLVSVLHGLQPQQLNAALGALSQTLSDRGTQLGTYLRQANAYLVAFNRSLPTMAADTNLARTVTAAYSQIAPQLLNLLANTTKTGTTLVSQDSALKALLASLQDTSNTTRVFLANNKVPLTEAMDMIEPSTTTAARYAPMFPCLFAALNAYRRDVEPASGGIYPGLWVRLSVLPGADPYVSPANLPKVVADTPSCVVPRQANDWYIPQTYGDGSPNLDNTHRPITPNTDPLAIQLFGTSVTVGAPTRPGGK